MTLVTEEFHRVVHNQSQLLHFHLTHLQCSCYGELCILSLCLLLCLGVFQGRKILQVHVQLQILLEALQMHALPPSYITLGLLQIIFFILLVELKLFSQMLITLDIYHWQNSIPLCSHCH
ncbi:hypothetical protein ACB098_04G039800 [Castanea mollissima]